MKKNYYNRKEKKIKYLSLMKIIHMLKVNQWNIQEIMNYSGKKLALC